MASTLTCQQLAKLAGVSVRTLHHYDKIGLLKPAIRTETRYRHYGAQEQLRLQQILFYKELGFALEEIGAILDEPDFDLRHALRQHKAALQARRDRLTVLLRTIDETMSHLNGERNMLTNEELYAGFPQEQAARYRREAVEKYGAAVVEESEQKLRQLGPAGFGQLKAEQEEINRTLASLAHLEPSNAAVQEQIARHYANIRGFWSESVCQSKNMAEAYSGLAQLCLDDPRYTSQNGVANPTYATFLSAAMRHFIEAQLK